jgi:tetratricopeptide (TPR) repeat protein
MRNFRQTLCLACLAISWQFAGFQIAGFQNADLPMAGSRMASPKTEGSAIAGSQIAGLQVERSATACSQIASSQMEGWQIAYAPATPPAVAASKPESVPISWLKDREIGTTAVRNRDYKAAELAFRRALAAARKLGKATDTCVTSLNDLASLYASEKRFNDARPLFAQVLEITETKVGKDSIELITPLNNLVRVSCAAGNCYDTVPQLKQLLDIRRKKLGEYSREVPITLLLLGEAYEKKGKYSQSLTFFKEAVQTEEHISGANSPLYKSLSRNVTRVEAHLTHVRG